MRENTEPTDLRALRHPLFLAALGLLILNDHVLKGGELVPAWLTGKLSDFAGLIVAPVALSVLLRARGAPRRAVAFGLVATWFVAINLSSGAAALTCDLLAAVGIPSRLWVDPTDLIALAILPLSWHISAQRLDRPARWPARVTLGFAVAACMATSISDPPQAAGILHNDTGVEMIVNVRWASAAVDCAEVRDRLGAALTDASFGPNTRFVLPADRVMSLDRRSPGDTSLDTFTGAFGSSGLSAPENAGGCEVALLEIDGLPSTIAFWPAMAPQGYPQTVGSDDEREDAARGVVLHAVADDDDALELRAGRGFRLAETIDDYTGDRFCADYGAPQRFDWAGFGDWSGETVRIVAIEEGADGCLALRLEAELAERDASLCIPRADFPFHVNAEVTVWANEAELRIVRHLPLEDGGLWNTGELHVVRDVDGWVQGPFDLRVTPTDLRCTGERLECGGFRVPVSGGLQLPTGVRFVHAGETSEADADDGRRAHLRVGRVESTIVADGCVGSGGVGPSLDALVWYGEAPRL